MLPIALATLLLPATGWSREVPLKRMPISFVPNAGQSDAAVRFQADTLGGTLFFTPSEVVLALPRTVPGSNGPGAARDLDVGRRAGGSGERGVPVTILRLRFVDAARLPEVAGADLLPGVFNVFRGSDPTRWRAHLPTYASIVYRNLYPGIDLRYEGVEGRIKGSYIVGPGADPSRIRWSYAGARSTRLDDAGNLLIALPPDVTEREAAQAGLAAAGPVTVVMENEPVAWQDVEGGHLPVPTRYTLAPDGTIGFALPSGYDLTRPLILDPTLTYSTYQGGGGEDVAYDIAVDSSGTYVTGGTLSTDFPTLGAIDPGCGTDGNCDGFAFYDAFVAKLNPSLSGAASLVFSTFLGGSADDFGLRIAVDPTGASYVTGQARADFPTTVNAFQPTYGGAPGADAFMTKLSADGSQLLYSTYLGGSGGDGAWGIALDASNNVYLAGETTSGNFPTTVGVLDTSCGTDGACNGASDAFVAKLNPGASGAASLLFSTYLGGAASDQAFGMARDAANDLYVTGRTSSTDFPTAGAPYQASSAGDYDGFVTKLNAAGTALIHSTYLGGSGYDDGYTVALGTSNRVYMAGTTVSFNFPTSAAAFESSFGGVNDAYFAKLDPAAAGAASLVYSTYLGGNDDDQGYGLAVDGSDVAYVAGYTRSPNFPTAGGPFQPVNGGFWDAFVTKVDPAASGGASLVYSTFLGGLSTDAAFGVALDPSRNIHVTGQTLSFNFPTVDPFQGTHGGNSDAFVAVIDLDTASADLSVVQTDAPDPVSLGTNLTYTFTVANAGPVTATGVRLADVVFGNAVFVSATPSQGSCTNVDLDVSCNLGSLASSASATVTVVVNPTFVGTITSTASVSSNVSDPDGLDNTAFESTTVIDLIFADDFETG